MQMSHEKCDVASHRCDLKALRTFRPTAERCRERGAVMEDLCKTSHQVLAASLQKGFVSFRSRCATRPFNARSHLGRQPVHTSIANGITDHGRNVFALQLLDVADFEISLVRCHACNKCRVRFVAQCRIDVIFGGEDACGKFIGVVLISR